MINGLKASNNTCDTAAWEKRSSRSKQYNCTNCGHEETPGNPPHSFRLGRFCPTCGLKMINPPLVFIKEDAFDLER